MPTVLNAGASLMCIHGGKVQLSPSQHLLVAGGQPVLVQGDLEGKPISNCPIAGPGIVPCATIVSMLVGAATKLTVGGKPVLLETATGITSSSPPGTFQVVSAGQTELEAI
jgi:hypothetical protein